MMNYTQMIIKNSTKNMAPVVGENQCHDVVGFAAHRLAGQVTGVNSN